MSNNGKGGGGNKNDDTSVTSHKKADIDENGLHDTLTTDERTKSQTLPSDEVRTTSANVTEEKMESAAKPITDNHGATIDDNDAIYARDDNNDAGHCDPLDAEDKTGEADLTDDASRNGSSKDDSSSADDGRKVDPSSPSKASTVIVETTKIPGTGSSNRNKRSTGKRVRCKSPPNQISQTLRAGATETSERERRQILAEVREHLDILKDFEGVISEEEINERKRQLFLFSTSAVPVLSSVPSQAGIEAANDEIYEPKKKKLKITRDSDSSDEDEEGIDDSEVSKLDRARLRKPKQSKPKLPPGTKTERMKIVTIYAKKMLEGQLSNQPLKERFGKPTKMVKEAQMIYPWLTMRMVRGKSARMKEKMKKDGLI